MFVLFALVFGISAAHAGTSSSEVELLPDDAPFSTVRRELEEKADALGRTRTEQRAVARALREVEAALEGLKTVKLEPTESADFVRDALTKAGYLEELGYVDASEIPTELTVRDAERRLGGAMVERLCAPLGSLCQTVYEDDEDYDDQLRGAALGGVPEEGDSVADLRAGLEARLQVWYRGVLSRAEALVRPSSTGKVAIADGVDANAVFAALQNEQQDLEALLGAEKQILTNRNAELTQTLDALRVFVADAERRLDEAGSVDRKLTTYIIPLFGVLAFLMPLGPRLYRDPETQRTILNSGMLIEFVTVYLLTSTILILGISGKIQNEVLGTLIGGISGYILNRTMRAGDRSGEPGAITQAAPPPPRPPASPA